MPDPAGQNAVELRGVVKRYSTFTAIRRLDLTIRKGEFFTLLGASGCGKTTTLRLIAGFELPTEGHVLIEDEDVSDVPAHLRPVHTVFQNYALFPHLNIRDNVAFPLTVRRLPRRERAERARAALDLVRMGDYGDRKPSQLSGGQQQRIALARALVNEPKVLLLDEPLGALDLKLRKEMQHELKEMQRRLGITFVFVTHDQEEALTMSDRIALMKSGEIVQIDTPLGLYNNPSTLYAADFIGETNMIRGRVAEGTADRLLVEALGTKFDMAGGGGSETGAPVTLTIRPERVRLVDDDGPNVVSGTLADVDFIGTDMRLILQAQDGTRLALRQQNAGAPVPAIGSRIRVRLEAADLRHFPEE